MYLGASLSKTAPVMLTAALKLVDEHFTQVYLKGAFPPGAIADIWEVAVQPVLLYATQSIYLCKSNCIALELTQSQHVKSSLGLSKFCKNMPLFQALKLQKISDILDGYYLNMLKSNFNNDSRSHRFYACLQGSIRLVKWLVILI